MKPRLLVINAVGLELAHIQHMPFLQAWLAGRAQAQIKPMLPAVTCAVQATYLTGVTPAEHGIVGNGWYYRDTAEVSLWKQSFHLVQKPYLWHDIKKRDPNFKVANIGWWFNMYSGADYSVTPRPQYRANNLKVPDCYTSPATWRDELQAELGQFPLFHYWGPRTTIKSTLWLAEAALRAELKWQPDLSLVYLPHLDYNLQRRGPDHASNVKDLQELDEVLKKLISALDACGAEVLILSEYAIGAVQQPVHINRILRQAGYLTLRTENGKELLDAGGSRAFAVADHQVAHVYVQQPEDVAAVKSLLEKTAGIAQVLDQQGKEAAGLNHARCGELVAVAEPEAWFTYYYWQQEDKAPDFAHLVDIHKKPGYDPVELFADPAIKALPLVVVSKLLRRKLGFNVLMDIIPTDASLVKGSHGIVQGGRYPVLLGSKQYVTKDLYEASEIRGVIEAVLGG